MHRSAAKMRVMGWGWSTSEGSRQCIVCGATGGTWCQERCSCGAAHWAVGADVGCATCICWGERCGIFWVVGRVRVSWVSLGEVGDLLFGSMLSGRIVCTSCSC